MSTNAKSTEKTRILTQREFLEQLSNAHVEVFPFMVNGEIKRGTKNGKRPHTAQVVIPDGWIEDVFGMAFNDSKSVFVLIRLDREEYRAFAEEAKARKEKESEDGRQENKPAD